jgi:phage shock protein E
MIKMSLLTELLLSPGTVIVDVRSPEEFNTGHAEASVNIPLNELNSRLDELKQMKNIVLCCASGMRSQMASQLLKQNGIDCCDGGSWVTIKNYSMN